jgi:PhnB protein
MASVATYLNFMGNTEEAFTFYKEVFGTDFQGPMMRLGDGPAGPGSPALTEAEQRMIMHIELPILGGHVLMGTDMLESMGHQLRVGNNTTISLMIDTREETERLYGLLSQGSTEAAPLSDMPWGYWGVCLDRFSIRWMFNGPSA